MERKTPAMKRYAKRFIENALTEAEKTEKVGDEAERKRKRCSAF